MNKTVKNVLGATLVVALSAGVARYTAQTTRDEQASSHIDTTLFTQPTSSSPSHLVNMNGVSSQPVDLTTAAEKSLHAVVHIKSTAGAQQQQKQQYGRQPQDIFEYFFGTPQRQYPQRQRQQQVQPQVGFGSGVIISSDGYIVTNNHVVEKADEVEVTLNDNRTFQATVIGTDASTDLALLKISGDEFPTIPVGDSEALKVGEWVLAVGNPFNLTSTVTAGIVSAKARTLGVYNQGVESFIQTDAAINKGNSGGALVNARGELIGINAVLYSRTGSYAGYGFAIPTTIMTKVVSDLKKYGTVQRALLGIMGSDVGNNMLPDELKEKEEELGVVEGIHVQEVVDNGAAAEAGVKTDDVIVGLNSHKITKMAELQEQLAQHSPGDKITLQVVRNKKKMTIEVTLRNEQGTTKVIKKADQQVLGAAFIPVPAKVRHRLNLGYGLQVTGVQAGRMKDAGISKGIIMLKANGVQLRTEEDFNKVFRAASRTPEQVIFINAMYPSGRRVNFAVDISQD